jgi:hypothetical protein
VRLKLQGKHVSPSEITPQMAEDILFNLSSPLKYKKFACGLVHYDEWKDGDREYVMGILDTPLTAEFDGKTPHVPHHYLVFTEAVDRVAGIVSRDPVLNAHMRVRNDDLPDLSQYLIAMHYPQNHPDPHYNLYPCGRKAFQITGLDSVTRTVHLTGIQEEIIVGVLNLLRKLYYATDHLSKNTDKKQGIDFISASIFFKTFVDEDKHVYVPGDDPHFMYRVLDFKRYLIRARYLHGALIRVLAECDRDGCWDDAHLFQKLDWFIRLGQLDINYENMNVTSHEIDQINISKSHYGMYFDYVEEKIRSPRWYGGTESPPPPEEAPSTVESIPTQPPTPSNVSTSSFDIVRPSLDEAMEIRLKELNIHEALTPLSRQELMELSALISIMALNR